MDFYHSAVEWDKENLWEDFIANGDFIEKIKSDDATAVLTEDISTGIYQYRFKIIKYDNSDDREYYDIGFGIISSREFE